MALMSGVLTPGLRWVRAIEPYRLAVTPCPLGFEELPSQIETWRQAGIDCVVSLLETREAKHLGLDRERDYCERMGLRFISLPIPDHGLPPSSKAFNSLVKELANEIAGGQAVVAHCYAGIGRTGLLAACVLHKLGVPTNQIFEVLKDARGYDMPETPAQREWVENFIGGSPR